MLVQMTTDCRASTEVEPTLRPLAGHSRMQRHSQSGGIASSVIYRLRMPLLEGFRFGPARCTRTSTPATCLCFSGHSQSDDLTNDCVEFAFLSARPTKPDQMGPHLALPDSESGDY